jgi:hypothetical protein
MKTGRDTQFRELPSQTTQALSCMFLILVFYSSLSYLEHNLPPQVSSQVIYPTSKWVFHDAAVVLHLI